MDFPNLVAAFTETSLPVTIEWIASTYCFFNTKLIPHSFTANSIASTIAFKKFRSYPEAGAIISNIPLQPESGSCTSKYSFSPSLGGGGGGKWRIFEHAHASSPGLSFQALGISPYMATGNKSSGTGLAHGVTWRRVLLPKQGILWTFNSYFAMS